MEKEEMRKGPWTEQEDCQLIFYVKLFGDRRWDFIAKVSGLKRTGKSCRLRWVNYLHPGLKRDKMTPHEERLVVDLQSKWGNRWSRIARKLPGRTDNEIKNYWRTHMRKEAQERKKKKGSSSSSSASASSSSSSSNSSAEEEQERSFYDTGGVDDLILADAENATGGGGGEKKSGLGLGLGLEVEEGSKLVYSMDDIWKEFEFTEGLTSHTVASPVWDDYCTTDSLWCINIEEESKMLMQQQQQQQPMGDHHFQSFPFCNNMIG